MFAMGCTVSKTDIQVGITRPWVYCDNGQQIDLTKEELKMKREVGFFLYLQYYRNFGRTLMQGKKKFVMSYRNVVQICSLVCKIDITLFLGNVEEVNEILSKLKITVISGELSLVKDEEGNTYSIEKFCYSNPSNLKIEESLSEMSICFY